MLLFGPALFVKQAILQKKTESSVHILHPRMDQLPSIDFERIFCSIIFLFLIAMDSLTRNAKDITNQALLISRLFKAPFKWSNDIFIGPTYS